MKQNVTKTEQPVFQIRNLVKTREKGDCRFDLTIEDFTIRKGEFVAIVGQSGCGKSTLLDMLGLALRPGDAETFSIYSQRDGTEYGVMGMEEPELADLRKSHIGYVLQTGGLLPFLTVKENILLPCRINHMVIDKQYAHELAAKLNISEQLNKKPQYLSGGQRQRVAIARALAHRPPIVLADEPTAAVDKVTAETIIKEFKDLTKEMDVTLLMVTHDMSLVETSATRMFSFDVMAVNDRHTISRCHEKPSSENGEGEGEAA